MEMAQDSGGSTRSVEEIALDLRSMLRGIDEVDPGELADRLFQGDGEFLAEALDAFPATVNSLVRLFRAFVEGMEGLPPERSAEMMAGSVSGIDGAGIGEALNSLSRLMIKVYENDPTPLSAEKMGVASEAVEAVDFGKLRKALTYKARADFDYRFRQVDLLGDQPVAIINLFNVVPEYINGFLELLTRVFTILVLPSEAMTFALFKILEEIDWQELSRTVNAGSKFVNLLHKGDLILGDGGTRIPSVASQIAGDLALEIDWEEVLGAYVALREYKDAVFAVAAVELMGDGVRLERLTDAAAAVTVSKLRGYSLIAEEVESMPEESIRVVTRGIAESLDARELGSTINSSLAAFNRISGSDPDYLESILSEALSQIDTEQASKACRTLISSVGRAVRANPGLAQKLGPAAFGAAVNESIASFNRYAREDPESIALGAGDFLAQLDAEQMGEAAEAIASAMAEAAFKNPSLTVAVLKGALSGIVRFLIDYLKSFWSGGSRARR